MYDSSSKGKKIFERNNLFERLLGQKVLGQKTKGHCPKLITSS
jgi:hypothetical protein